MRPTPPLNVDFAALRTLVLVHKHRSFTAAAEALGINQSAVSYTIEKLRGVFDDPLFYRQGARVMATERCAVIVSGADQMLDGFAALVAPATFNATSGAHIFTIACNYFERLILVPHLVRWLRKSAPNVRLNLIASTARGDQQLKDAEADLLIGPIRPEQPGFFCRTLFDEDYVCMMDPAHPLATSPGMARDAYLAASHIVVTYGGNWRSGYLQQIEAENLTLAQPLAVPSPAGLRQTIKGTDLIATVPRRLAIAEGTGLHVADCPFPAPFQIDLVWTTRTNMSAPHIWLRQEISRIAGQLRS